MILRGLELVNKHGRVEEFGHWRPDSFDLSHGRLDVSAICDKPRCDGVWRICPDKQEH